jgi:DHA2 family multidrug resistance protein-like MFS transporter
LKPDGVLSGDGLPQPQRFWAVVTTAIAVFLTVVGASVANVALPTIAMDIGVDASAAVWIINAYQVAILVALLPLASLGEIIGYRAVYLWGLALFTAASIACALATSLPALILFRIVQGVGAAGVMSVNQALVRFIHPSQRLGYGIGITAVVIAVSAAAGPAIASAILAVLSWPWLFALGVPLGVVALAIGLRALPATPQASRKFDAISTVLSAIAFAGLIALIDTLGREGSALLIGAELAVTMLSGLLLWRRQVATVSPMLPVDLLRIPAFTLSIVVCAASFAAQMLALIVLPFELTAAGYSAVEIGLLMIPWPLATAIVAPISGSLSDRYPAGLLGLLGLLMFAAGLAALAMLPERASPINIIWPMALAGAGFGLYQSPNNRTIQGAAPRARSGAASGMASLARLLGQTIGAALAAFLFSRLSGSGAIAALWLGAAFAALGGFISAARLTHSPQPKQTKV